MGWEADATKDGEMLDEEGNDVRHRQLADPALRSVFADAAARVEREWGSGKIDMVVGKLDGYSYKLVIERATGASCFDQAAPLGEMYWSPSTVQRLSAGADWDFPVEDELDISTGDCYYEYDHTEARLFLETCAEHGLGIKFSW